jgi:hypothetical protein
VTAALRQMSQQRNAHFSVFHQVLNRARWSPLAVSRRLLQVLVDTFVHAGGTVEWDMRSILMEPFLCSKPPGTPRRTRPSATFSLQSVDMCGVG